MIVDRLENWKTYPLGETWKRAMAFLSSLGPDAEEKEYALDGERAFARIMSYQTRAQETAAFEAHRKYADIQAVLSGEEILEWAPLEGLELSDPYNEAKDIEFYDRTDGTGVPLILRPGLFTLLLPQDAHAPQLHVGDTPNKVKKIVIKLDIDLLRSYT